MLVQSISLLSDVAVKIVKTKYPKEFCDPSCSFAIFELIELVGDELARKNSKLFTAPFLSQLVDVHDVAYGDRVEFVVSD